jgi:hypothetical protein
MFAAILLILLGFYLVAGLLFAVPFVWFGVKNIDPHAARGSWGFRLCIFPGVTVFWPLLLHRWTTGQREPAQAITAHRRAAKNIDRQSVESKRLVP